jgi:hypothetical protein
MDQSEGNRFFEFNLIICNRVDVDISSEITGTKRDAAGKIGVIDSHRG